MAELAKIAQSYCANNSASAIEARLRSRREELHEIESEVERKSAALGRLVEEARGWVERREKLWATIRETLVDTYSKMKPEAAAQQLGAMSDEAAASIVTKLSARAASAIMNEMSPEPAARLADRALRRSDQTVNREKNGS